jgi:hypothetical protein
MTVKSGDFESPVSANSTIAGSFADAFRRRAAAPSDNILYLRCASRLK